MFVNGDRFPEFSDWLRRQGADVLSPSNCFEKLRFRAKGQVYIVYQDKYENMSHIPVFVDECWKAFVSGGSVNMGITKHSRTTAGRRKMALFQRDGDKCFFCSKPMTFEEASVEHLVPVRRGGPTNMDNLVLAHVKCNKEIDDMPLIEKIKVHRENWSKVNS